MRHAIHLLVLAAAAICLTVPATGDTLDALRWRHRLVVLFGSGPEADQQRAALLERRADLDERRILLIEVGREVSVLHGAPDARLPNAATLRARLGVDPADAYEAVLIGLDGGVKWRSQRAVETATLFGVIDAMPMRRAENRAIRS